jgi:hypothetical protein
VLPELELDWDAAASTPSLEPAPAAALSV